jgi:hypothetical protein
MRRLTSILCSFAFLLSGVLIALVANDLSPGNGYKQATAATLPEIVVYPQTMDVASLPKDLLLDLAKQQGLNISEEQTTSDVDSAMIDSLQQRIQILEQRKPVTMVKWKKVPVPKPIVKRDTIREAHYYLATQVGTKEGPTGECIPIYEVHKVDEICPETNNSSMTHTPQYDNDVGD